MSCTATAETTTIPNKNGPKLTALERFVIGILAYASVPYAFVKERYDISERYYYSLKDKAVSILVMLFPTDLQGDVLLLEITDQFIERCVIGLMMICHGSVQNIEYFMDCVIGVPVSRHVIYDIQQRAYWQAFLFNSGIDLSGIKDIAIDEIFKSMVPYMAGVDISTGYVFLLTKSPDRKGETWARVLSQLKEQGFNPVTSLSDAGGGLLAGAAEAFPDLERLIDVFHSLFELGGAVDRIVKHVEKHVTEFCDLDTKIKQGRKLKDKTVDRYNDLAGRIDKELDDVATLQTLYGWLKEHMDFNGYSYQYNYNMCCWILDEMAALYPANSYLQYRIRLAKERLPLILKFHVVVENKLEALAREYGVRKDDFMLMYHHIYAASGDMLRYDLVEKRLYKVFRGRMADARLAVEQVIQTTYRASSYIENANSRFRVYLDCRKGNVSEGYAGLLMMYENTKKQGRTRRGWSGTSAYDRLTGRDNPEFLDLLFGPKDYRILKAG